MISAVILAKNEEKNIERCLKSLQWCDEILVIDDYSTDETITQISRFNNLNLKIYKRQLNGDFAKQRNYGLEKAKGNWVLFIDADEEVSSTLAREIKSVTESATAVASPVTGFYFKRIDLFMGKWLKHGEIGGIGGVGGINILRLAKKGAGKWQRRVDEIWEIKGKTEVLKNPLLHFSHPTLSEFLKSINERSTLNAKVFIEHERKVGLCECFKPLGKFILNYFLKLGFLDGIQGFIFAVLMSLHSFMVRGKLYLLLTKENRKEKRDKTGKLIFILWVVFVFASYLYFLFQRGLAKWSN